MQRTIKTNGNSYYDDISYFLDNNDKEYGMKVSRAWIRKDCTYVDFIIFVLIVGGNWSLVIIINFKKRAIVMVVL
jgi:hypothetical protein